MIDGRLEEAVWQRAQATDAFTQKRPFEGEPPGERTTVRILHDDSAVHIGVS